MELPSGACFSPSEVVLVASLLQVYALMSACSKMDVKKQTNWFLLFLFF